jgi:site-specific recombinase XerD
MKPTPFPQLLHAFFHDWLVQQRNISHHTVLSYRDSWRLFLRFVAGRKKKTVAQLGLTELTADDVLEFLQHVEQERKASIGTRNCRLAAVRSFFSFVADREPLASAQCAEVLRIPTKRAPQHALCYLDENEFAAILAQPDCSRIEGQRDHVLLAVLYNTGARIQEALNITPRALRLESPFQVRLFGKGRKERICPLWPETGALLKALLKRRPRGEAESIFVNRYGCPLGSAGVRFKLSQYVAAAEKKVPSLASKRVTPHTFRHSAAVGLVTAGVDVTVIRDWLGHASLDTTNHYARANVETKRKALEKVHGSSTLGKPPRWKRDAELMVWLDSL